MQVLIFNYKNLSVRTYASHSWLGPHISRLSKYLNFFGLRDSFTIIYIYVTKVKMLFNKKH